MQSHPSHRSSPNTWTHGTRPPVRPRFTWHDVVRAARLRPSDHPPRIRCSTGVSQGPSHVAALSAQRSPGDRHRLQRGGHAQAVLHRTVPRGTSPLRRGTMDRQRMPTDPCRHPPSSLLVSCVQSATSHAPGAGSGLDPSGGVEDAASELVRPPTGERDNGPVALGELDAPGRPRQRSDGPSAPSDPGCPRWRTCSHDRELRTVLGHSPPSSWAEASTAQSPRSRSSGVTHEVATVPNALPMSDQPPRSSDAGRDPRPAPLALGLGGHLAPRSTRERRRRRSTPWPACPGV